MMAKKIMVVKQKESYSLGKYERERGGRS